MHRQNICRILLVVFSVSISHISNPLAANTKAQPPHYCLAIPAPSLSGLGWNVVVVDPKHRTVKTFPKVVINQWRSPAGTNRIASLVASRDLQSSTALYIGTAENPTLIRLEDDLGYVNGLRQDVSLVWSHDGQQIAYSWATKDDTYTLKITNADGTNSASLKLEQADSLQVLPFSPDDKFFATVSPKAFYPGMVKRNQIDIWSIGERRVLISYPDLDMADPYIEWSPEGDLIYRTNKKQLRALSTSKQEDRLLLDFSAYKNNDPTLRWSPTRKYLFASNYSMDNDGILFSADGKRTYQIIKPLYWFPDETKLIAETKQGIVKFDFKLDTQTPIVLTGSLNAPTWKANPQDAEQFLIVTNAPFGSQTHTIVYLYNVDDNKLKSIFEITTSLSRLVGQWVGEGQRINLDYYSHPSGGTFIQLDKDGKLLSQYSWDNSREITVSSMEKGKTVVLAEEATDATKESKLTFLTGTESKVIPLGKVSIYQTWMLSDSLFAIAWSKQRRSSYNVDEVDVYNSSGEMVSKIRVTEHQMAGEATLLESPDGQVAFYYVVRTSTYDYVKIATPNTATITFKILWPSNSVPHVQWTNCETAHLTY